jgi:hypothetical protein
MQLGNGRVPQVIFKNIFHVISYNIQGDPGEMSVIWEVIVSAIVRKKEVHMNMCPILNGHGESERAVCICKTISIITK